jgi:hypothetical protein
LQWITRKPVLDNPERKPWHDLTGLHPDFHFEPLIPGGGYFICNATKSEQSQHPQILTIDISLETFDDLPSSPIPSSPQITLGDSSDSSVH